jgi:hypothetical protein
VPSPLLSSFTFFADGIVQATPCAGDTLIPSRGFSGARRGFLYVRQRSGSRCLFCYRAGEGLEGRGEVRESRESSAK